jgi:hypothetical protein
MREQMAQTLTNRLVELDNEAAGLSRGWGIRFERCGDAIAGGGSADTELVWSRSLARFGLSCAAEPLLEQRDWGA